MPSGYPPPLSRPGVRTRPELMSVSSRQLPLAFAREATYEKPMNREVRLRGLSSDHHHSLVLVRHIRHSLAQGEAIHELVAQVAAHYDRELEPHFIVEEELLLPQLENDSTRELAERTRSEHKLLRSLVADGSRGQLDALRALADALEAHVRFEERELYPACETVVPRPVLDEVARRVPKH